MSVHMLIGRKEGMTQLFDESGRVVPVTVLTVGPCPVVQVKSAETDGYHAVQIGFAPTTRKRTTKPLVGHFKSAGVEPQRVLREVRLDAPAELERGATVSCGDVFEVGRPVDVTGTSKGRGFAGTIKRWNFSRGPMSHGSKNIREPGSTGMHTWPARVFKGKKMPGQYGNKRRTVKNLEVVKIEPETNRVYVRGAVPGPNGGTVLVWRAVTPAKKYRRAGAN